MLCSFVHTQILVESVYMFLCVYVCVPVCIVCKTRKAIRRGNLRGMANRGGNVIGKQKKEPTGEKRESLRGKRGLEKGGGERNK